MCDGVVSRDGTARKKLALALVAVLSLLSIAALHQHAPAADRDEGVMTGLLEWGVGGGPVIGPAPFFEHCALAPFSLPCIPR